MDKELSIITVDYKSSDFTGNLIADLEKHLTGVSYEIIVVDNDPDGGGAKKIKKTQRKIKIIKAKENRGFGAGNNLGAKSAKGKYLLFLNPDIKVVDDSIEKMLDFISKHAEIGALICLLYQRDAKTFQRHFFGRFQNLLTVLLRRQAGRLPAISDLSSSSLTRGSTNSNFFYSDMVSGAAMMVKREIFERTGGFDENFFMYFEDEDLCRRLSDSGYKNAVLSTARLIHYEGQSSTSLKKKKFYYKSQNYYWQKHYGRFLTILMKILRAPYILLQILSPPATRTSCISVPVRR